MIVFYVIPMLIMVIVLALGLKNQKVFEWLMMIMMIIIFSFNTNNNDYQAYYTFYNNVKLGTMTYITNNADSSPLFTISIQLIKTMGCNFNIYRLILIVTFLAILIICFGKQTKLGLVLLAYALYPFVFDLVQLRFACSAFAIISMAYYKAKDNRKMALMALIIAILFHSMNIVFAIILFVPCTKRFNPKVIRNFSIVAGLCLILFSMPIMNQFVTFVNSITYFGEYQHYLNRTVNRGYLLYIIYQICNILFAGYISNGFEECDEDNIWKNRFNTFNYNLQSIGILFVGLLTLNINFSRYFRILYLLNAISFASMIESQYKKRNSISAARVGVKLINIVFFCVWIGIFMIGQYVFNQSQSNILQLVFDSFK